MRLLLSYGHYKHDMLKEFLKLPYGIPSSVTLWRVFERLDAIALEGKGVYDSMGKAY